MSISRKHRRLQVRKSPGEENRAEQKKKIGMNLKNEGRDADAVVPLKEALRLNPSFADVHFTLAMMARTNPGLNIDMGEINKTLADRDALLSSYYSIIEILRKNRQYKEAAVCQEEYCRLLPHDPVALMNLGLVQNMNGGGEKAVLDMARAVNMAPDNKMLKSVFVTSVHNPDFSKFYPEVKEAILKCLENPYDVNLFKFSKTWLSLMSHDPLYQGIIHSFSMTSDNTFNTWMDGLDEKTGSFLRDPYLLQGLKIMIVTFHLMERTLTKMRRYILLSLSNLQESGRIKIFEPFIYALAENCFFNEYVFSQDTEEDLAVNALFQKMKENPECTSLGILSCYIPLRETMRESSDALHRLAAGNSDFSRLVKTQYDEPMEEGRLKKDIPAFGNIANETSVAVRNQYEENPYPRWTTICCAPLPSDDLAVPESKRYEPYNILIAGCGTGRQPIGAAARHPRAKITAIDLSRASLAYGMRKANECGVADRIDFVQSDILSLSAWPDMFDMIECSGVLHHMEDPFAGWKILNDRLKPGGYFKIGLYSETARKQIETIRTFVQANGYAATQDGIRAFRQTIMDLPSTNAMRQYLVNTTGDFYATSLVRDLVFHVQEHRMTLPQIKSMMDRLGLKCLKFLVGSTDTLMRYDRMFPTDTNRNNIENWIAFEEKYPLTFINMYQFWCQKGP